MGRYALILAVASLAFVPGCAGSSSSLAGAEGAKVAPASALAFVSVNADPTSEQWQSAETLLDEFPGYDELLGKTLGALEEEGLDFERDVVPALGPEIDVVLLPAAGEGRDPEPVLLTQPPDRAKLDALLAKLDHPHAVVEIDGWTAVADESATLDALTAPGTERLADSDAFTEAMAELDDDALVRVYASDDAEAAFWSEAVGGRAAADGDLEWAVAQLGAEDGGVRFESAAKMDDALEMDEYEATLAEDLPAGAAAYASFNDLDEGLARVRDALGERIPEFDRRVAQLELFLNLSLEEDVFSLFEDEGAVAVYAEPEPTVTLVLRVDDESEALRVVDRIATAGSQFLDGAEPRDVVVDGVDARELVIDGRSIFYAAFDGRLVVTTSEDGIRTLGDPAEPLGQDADFRRALEDAGMPEETEGFAYVDFESIFALVGAGSHGVEPDAEENLRPLDSLLVYAGGDGDIRRLTGFVSIR